MPQGIFLNIKFFSIHYDRELMIPAARSPTDLVFTFDGILPPRDLCHPGSWYKIHPERQGCASTKWRVLTIMSKKLRFLAKYTLKNLYAELYFAFQSFVVAILPYQHIITLINFSNFGEIFSERVSTFQSVLKHCNSETYHRS